MSTYEPGPALDALVHELVMGQSLAVPRDLAMVEVAQQYVAVTGPVWRLTGPRGTLILPMPEWESLPEPEGLTHFNQRYLFYAAKHLAEAWGQPFIDNVDAYRSPAPPYSTDIVQAMRVVEHLRQQGWLVRVQEMPDGWPYLDGTTGQPLFYAKSYVSLDWMPRDRSIYKSHYARKSTTTAHAVCLVGLASVEYEFPEGEG